MNFKLYPQKVKCDFAIWLRITNSLFFFVFLLKKTMTLHVYSHFMYHIFLPFVMRKHLQFCCCHVCLWETPRFNIQDTLQPVTSWMCFFFLFFFGIKPSRLSLLKVSLPCQFMVMPQAEIACHYLHNGSGTRGERAESQHKGNFAVCIQISSKANCLSWHNYPSGPLGEKLFLTLLITQWVLTYQHHSSTSANSWLSCERAQASCLLRYSSVSQ